MSRTAEGSTARLVQLCWWYFFFYVITGVTLKWFTTAEAGPHMRDLEFLVFSTAGGNVVCLGVVLARGWWRLKSNGVVRVAGFAVPQEVLYIIPSGVCTGVVIPTTTLLYTLLPSVMVAMVVMRGSIIVISRLVDAVQIRQGILTKKVYREEDLAVVFALLPIAIQLLWPVLAGEPGKADKAPPRAFGVVALLVLAAYLSAYMIRIYIMNYYKNTRGKGVKLDNEGFFGVEQLSAAGTIGLATALFYFAGPALLGGSEQLAIFRGAFDAPKPAWPWAILAGTAFGMVAFFSVFIFMFKGRTATFAGLVNRLTSLIAGTAATLLFVPFGGKWPKTEDWASLGAILVAVGFLTVAERRRAAELAAAKELDVAPPPGAPAPPERTA